MSNPLQFESVIIGECGQEIVVMQPITFPVILYLSCSVHNGSGVNGKLLYKDSVLLRDDITSTIQVDNEDDLYGTYTFRVTTDYCGSTQAVTRILYQG